MTVNKYPPETRNFLLPGLLNNFEIWDNIAFQDLLIEQISGLDKFKEGWGRGGGGEREGGGGGGEGEGEGEGGEEEGEGIKLQKINKGWLIKL